MRRRLCVEHVCTSLGLSQRRVCHVLGQHRSTQRYGAVISWDEEALRNAMIGLARDYGRYGYRRITALLREQGWNINHKRIERLWREEGLKVPQTLQYKKTA